MKLHVYPDPILNEKSLPVEDHEDVTELVNGMKKIMLLHQGMGLAAPQVGVLKRVIITDIKGRGMVVLINPIIISSSGKFASEEGCLSVPGRRVYKKRFKFIKVQGRGFNKQPVTFKERGINAACIQHEIDHLNGKLIVD